MTEDKDYVAITTENAIKAGAVKYDQGKSPVFRGAIAYFPRSISGVAAVSGFGASKYAWNGWLHVPEGVGRYTDGLVRHLVEEGKGEVLDAESGLPHYLHVAWNALARAELMLIESGQKSNTI